MPLVGFLFDTTLAAAHAGLQPACPSGIPNIRWVLCHMGGAIPYLAERLDRGFDGVQGLPRATSTGRRART